MAQKKSNNISLSFPKQKISDSKKNDKWYEKCTDYAESLIYQSDSIKSTFENKQENYDLRSNIINPSNFKKYIDVDQIGIEKLPSQFKHIGIANNKINLLVGEYTKRKKDFKVYLSANDKEGVTRKEKGIKEELTKFVTDKLKQEILDPEKLQKEIQEFQKYIKYDYQDILEITANKILKKEYKEQFLGFLFEREIEDLLVSGEEIVYIDVLGGKPVIRRVDPRNLYTYGMGDSMNVEDAEIIVEYGYMGHGQIYDDYWDELSKADEKMLDSYVEGRGSGTGGSGLYRDMSIEERYGYDFDSCDDGVKVFNPRSKYNHRFGGSVNSKGEIRVMKVSWKGKRKVQHIKYYDEDGDIQRTYVSGNYKIDEDKGEELVATRWINEWYQTVKIGDDIYVKKKVIPFTGRSMVNISKCTPNYVGTYNSTNSNPVTSLMDIIKPLDYAYDIAYWKREIAIATYKGNASLLNISMIPSGWDPAEWLKYLTINKIGWLDPTAEIMKGPSQGKSAGMFNTLTGTNVNLGGDAAEIQMYNDYLFQIEQTMGKVSGISSAREGAIHNTEAVGNVEREVTQSSNITEKWYSIHDNFVKRALKKFLEACQYAYKENPINGAFILDDMGQVLIEQIDDFPSVEFDLHISNSTNDAQLFNDLKQLAHAAIQNGNAEFGDIISIYQSESVQEIARKLKISSDKLNERNQQAQQDQLKQQQAQQKAMLQDKKEQRAWEVQKHNDEMEIKREEVDIKREKGYLDVNQKENESRRKQDANFNGIADEIDKQLLENAKLQTKEDSNIKNRQIDETIRHNKESEKIDRLKISKTTINNKQSKNK